MPYFGLNTSAIISRQQNVSIRNSFRPHSLIQAKITFILKSSDYLFWILFTKQLKADTGEQRFWNFLSEHIIHWANNCQIFCLQLFDLMIAQILYCSESKISEELYK